VVAKLFVVDKREGFELTNADFAESEDASCYPGEVEWERDPRSSSQKMDETKSSPRGIQPNIPIHLTEPSGSTGEKQTKMFVSLGRNWESQPPIIIVRLGERLRCSGSDWPNRLLMGCLLRRCKPRCHSVSFGRPTVNGQRVGELGQPQKNAIRQSFIYSGAIQIPSDHGT